MPNAGIETHLTLHQADDIPVGPDNQSASAWELTYMYQISFAYILRYRIYNV